MTPESPGADIVCTEKRGEGYSINNIALLLHSAPTTVKKYLSVSKEDIPIQKENIRERRHIQEMANKKIAVNEARKLYSEGYAIDEIIHLTGHSHRTVKKIFKGRLLF
ncbi:hypothetical protein [Hungatella hathewayi]|uniref:hypothetical protein n=1 Tax=Hungatella hathewayi TaxID=154046 RepID=UPI003564C443